MNAYTSHFIELKKRIIICLICFVIILAPLIIFAGPLYHYFATPLLKILPANSHLIATQVTSPFIVPLKLAVFTSLMLIIPIIIYQAWAFVSPALYPNEKAPLKPLLFFSIILFYLGALFAYGIVCPLALSFFNSMAPSGVMVMTDMQHYLDFVLKLTFAFGLAFQVPIILLLLISLGITTPENLIEKRPYIIVGSFIIGMLLTPPDVISQILLAIPLWGLFELGLLIAKRQKKLVKQYN